MKVLWRPGQDQPSRAKYLHGNHTAEAPAPTTLIFVLFSLSVGLFLFFSPFHSPQKLVLLWPLQEERRLVNMSKPHSVNGSESEFEFIETPKAPTPTFEKFEDCGVRTTSVSFLPLAREEISSSNY